MKKTLLILATPALALKASAKGVAPSVIYTEITQAFEAAMCILYSIIVNITGAIATLWIVISGIRYIAARDDPAMRSQSVQRIKQALLGLIIIVLAKGFAELVMFPKVFNCSP